jgi:uncharacterized protein (TIGR03545 family)
MRKKFVLYVLIPLLILLLVTYFFIDRWIAAGMEYSGERIVGANVEIEHLKVSFSPLGIQFSRLQVANPDDPWKNLFETGNTRFTMDFGQLLRGKYIVETVEINDIILGTKRKTDGSIPGARRSASLSGGGQPFSELVQQLLEKTIEKTPLFDPAMLRNGVNIDSLVKAQHFQTLALIDSLRSRTATASREWDSTISSFEVGKKKLMELEASIKTIKPAELKSVDKITTAIVTVDNAKKTVDEVTGTFRDRKMALEENVQKLSSAAGTIDESVKKDFQKVLSMARLPDLNAMGLAELILGKHVLADAQKYAQWVDIARAQMEKYSSKPEIETPPRMRGQNVHFPVERGYPKFWIKNVKVSGGTDRTQDPEFVYVKGNVQNVSSDQRIAGEPMSIALEGTKGQSMSLTFAGLIDRRKEVTRDEFKARVTGIPLSSYALGKSDFLPSKITNALLNTEVAITIPGNAFDVNAALTFRNMTLEFMAEPRNLGERLARQVLSGVQGFDAGLRLWKKENGVDLAFTTTLDDQFASGVKAALGAELEKLQGNIRLKVEGAIAGKRKEFEDLYAKKRDELRKQLDAYQSVITEKTGMLDAKKKELQTRLEQEKSSAIDNLMKGVFKKK